MTDTRILIRNISFHHYNISQLTEKHNLTSPSMQLVNTERATLLYTR